MTPAGAPADPAAADPVILLTCGDPAGIGPELAPKARAELGAALSFAWVGDPRHLPPGTRVTEIDTPEAARAVALVQDGQAAALTTLPINKAALIDGAAFAFPGHTEYLAHLTGAARPVMMLVAPGLRTVPVTIHIPLAEVPRALTPDLLAETARITHAGLRRDFGINAPRLAVAGLNPHAGEAGKIGREEVDWMIATLDALRAEGLDLAGPLPADTMFHPEARARYDAALCMYHDQALIPVKTLDFAGGVNVTLGLPILRTSPDHGTAYGIAGQGIADPASTIAALRLAAGMARRRWG